MKYKVKKRMLAMIILIAVTVGLFEPLARGKEVEAKTKTNQEKKLADEIEQ